MHHAVEEKPCSHTYRHMRKNVMSTIVTGHITALQGGLMRLADLQSTSVRSMLARGGAPAVLWSPREAEGPLRGSFWSGPILDAELARAPNLAGVASWNTERAALCALRRSVGAEVGDAKPGTPGPPLLDITNNIATMYSLWGTCCTRELPDPAPVLSIEMMDQISWRCEAVSITGHTPALILIIIYRESSLVTGLWTKGVRGQITFAAAGH